MSFQKVFSRFFAYLHSWIEVRQIFTRKSRNFRYFSGQIRKKNWKFWKFLIKIRGLLIRQTSCLPQRGLLKWGGGASNMGEASIMGGGFRCIHILSHSYSFHIDFHGKQNLSRPSIYDAEIIFLRFEKESRYILNCSTVQTMLTIHDRIKWMLVFILINQLLCFLK